MTWWEILVVKEDTHPKSCSSDYTGKLLIELLWEFVTTMSLCKILWCQKKSRIWALTQHKRGERLCHILKSCCFSARTCIRIQTPCPSSSFLHPSCTGGIPWPLTFKMPSLFKPQFTIFSFKLSIEYLFELYPLKCLSTSMTFLSYPGHFY